MGKLVRHDALLLEIASLGASLADKEPAGGTRISSLPCGVLTALNAFTGLLPSRCPVLEHAFAVTT